MTFAAWMQAGMWYLVYEGDLPPDVIYVAWPPQPCDCSDGPSEDLHVWVWGETKPRHFAPNRQVKEATA